MDGAGGGGFSAIFDVFTVETGDYTHGKKGGSEEGGFPADLHVFTVRL